MEHFDDEGRRYCRQNKGAVICAVLMLYGIISMALYLLE